MRAEEARDFCEEDEDPTRVFAQFDAAEKGRTAKPKREPDFMPLREWLRKVRSELRQDMRDLQPAERFVALAHRIANMIGQHTKV